MSASRTALALLELRTAEWMERYGDAFPDLRDHCSTLLDLIDTERNTDAPNN